MSLAHLSWYILIVFCFSFIAVPFLYFIGVVFVNRILKLWSLPRIFKASFKSSEPSIESYGYRIVHNRTNERLFKYHFSCWQRQKFRLCLFLVAIGGIIQMYWLQIKSLCWAINIIHDVSMKKKRKKEEHIETILQDIIFMLRKNEIDKAQRRLKTSLENSDIKPYNPCNLLSLSLCNQMLQEIESAERVFYNDPKRDREEKRIVYSSLEKILEDLKKGNKYIVYDEIIKREMDFKETYG